MPLSMKVAVLEAGSKPRKPTLRPWNHVSVRRCREPGFLCVGGSSLTYPVEEWTRDDARPADFLLLALEVIDCALLCVEHGHDFEEARVDGVASVLGGQEALYASGDGGVDELVLVAEGDACDEREDGILALECGFQRVDGVVVGADDIDAGWEGGCRAFAG